jgi:hypothetical protein
MITFMVDDFSAQDFKTVTAMTRPAIFPWNRKDVRQAS